MRFLGIGDTVDLGAMYQRLQRRRHEVRVFARDPDGHDTMAGLVDRVSDWESSLPWIRDAGDEGFILFETASMGPLQETLRSQGFQVIGGNRYGDALESDRAFGQQELRAVGLRTAPSHRFETFSEAIDFVRQRPRRYVYKLNGTGYASTRTYLGELDDGLDLIAHLRRQARESDLGERVSLVLMDRLDGVEMGVGAYFNGSRFLTPHCVDWEHKRFFPGDRGELTGEMGTVASFRGGQALFDATLAKMAPRLKESGYVGYINLNTIVNGEGAWPLELTCRFGYPGFAVLDALQLTPWDELFVRLARREVCSLETAPGYSVAVVLSVPPFPYRHGYPQLSKGAPIFLRPGFSTADESNLHWGEVARSEEDGLVASGVVGYVGVATGRGETIESARRAAHSVADQVVVPGLRYRNDIGEKLIREELQKVRTWGWL